MSEIDPNVLAQMKRIWSAVNDGTLDKDAVNDALKQMHDFLSGAAYEQSDPVAIDEDGDEVVEHDTGSSSPPVHAKKPRKKR